ncbi:MAG: SusC/RagA family TonB-linked outer membrane protein [Candidatus Nephrothrix sp. EaCA]|nr:MAG: SusC/RagA family TonB-linked outer membrane protein [Candidatus Nephrothrix sp. EaCA]
MKNNYGKQRFCAWLMKGLILQLFLLCSIFSAAGVFPSAGQGILKSKISLNVEGMKIKSILKKIEDAGTVRFAYQPNQIDVDRMVSLSIEDLPLENVLGMIFDHSVLFEERGELVVLNPSITGAKNNTIVNGRVTEENGQPAPGVNVLEKGTANGTVTDVNGEYSLNVSNGATLVFSAIGYLTKEVLVDGQLLIDVAMQSDVKQLDEVVVNAIGEKRSRDKMGVAIPVVSGNSITQSGEAGLINGLAGKAEGLIITRNGGEPGAGSYIQLRGQSTISGSVQPLIVIDGMPMFNSSFDTGGTRGVNSAFTYMTGTSSVQEQSRMNDLNPADIANVEILKGASAAALWGSRAANGVIVITTKKGANTNGKAQISYTGSVSFDVVNKMPQLQTKFGQGLNGMFKSGDASSFGDLISARSGGEDTYTGAPYVEFPDGVKHYAIVPGTASNAHGGKNSRNVYDHTNDVFGTGKTLEHSISLSGGGEKNQILVSYANTDQKGIVKANSDYKKNVVRVNFQSLIAPKLNSVINVNYSNIRSNRAPQGNNISGILLGQMRSAPDFDNSRWIGTAYAAARGVPTFNKHISYRNPIGVNPTPVFDNPLWTMFKNKSHTVINRVLGNIELKYDWTDWLTLNVNSGLDAYSEHRTDFGDAQSAASLGGSYTDQYISESQWNTNLFAVGSKKFTGDFFGSATIGFNYNALQFNNVGASATKFTVPNAPPDLTNSPAANRSPFNNASTTRTSAGFFELNGDFFNQLFVTATGRAETASTFGPEAQSLFFYPSISGAWQFTKLIGKNDILTFGKLRASYGIVGKQPSAYLNLTTYPEQIAVNHWGPQLSGNAYGAGGYGLSTQAGNPKIKPEKKHEFELGMDLRFLKDRVTLATTAYINKTTDVILSTQVAASSGFSFKTGNVGAIENKGLEFNLGANWIKRPKGISWSSNFIWSTYRNKVLDLAGADFVFLGGFNDCFSAAVKGQPLGVTWGKYWETDEKGNYLLSPHGFPQVSNNKGMIGNPNPDFRTSLGNNFSYKNITLYFLFEASVGGQIWNCTRGALINFGTSAATANQTTVSAAEAAALRTADGRTIATTAGTVRNGDGTYTFRGTIEDFGGGKVAVEQFFYRNAYSGFSVNKAYMEDATWTRLREVTLSYNLNTKSFQSFSKMKSATFAITGRNLLLWTPYSGIDPDTNLLGSNNARGLDAFQNPNTRSIILKLSLNF